MDTLSLAIQYIFTSGEHEMKIAPHGNSKGGESAAMWKQSKLFYEGNFVLCLEWWQWKWLPKPINELDLPAYVEETVWNRAKALVQDQSAMVPAPGDDSALMVMSNSGQQPHYVRQSKAGGYVCDDHCLATSLLRFVPIQ